MTDLPKLVQQLLDEQNLTVYGLSQLIAAETDEPIKTIHERVSNMLKRSPKTWVQTEQMFKAFGYKITIKKITND